MYRLLLTFAYFSFYIYVGLLFTHIYGLTGAFGLALFEPYIGLFWHIYTSLLMCIQDSFDICIGFLPAFVSRLCVHIRGLTCADLFWHTYRSLLTYIQVSVDICIDLLPTVVSRLCVHIRGLTSPTKKTYMCQKRSVYMSKET